jgi:hypothetical protein
LDHHVEKRASPIKPDMDQARLFGLPAHGKYVLKKFQNANE